MNSHLSPVIIVTWIFNASCATTWWQNDCGSSCHVFVVTICFRSHILHKSISVIARNICRHGRGAAVQAMSYILTLRLVSRSKVHSLWTWIIQETQVLILSSVNDSDIMWSYVTFNRFNVACDWLIIIIIIIITIPYLYSALHRDPEALKHEAQKQTHTEEI